jgi:ankyrin repeat protein/catechol 2,3-dioxygenase-like lactoylglutathione lyase family enzyme
MPNSDFPAVAEFIDACARGDVEVLRGLLANDPSLARVGAHTEYGYGGWTGLHEAAKQGRLDAVRLLLEHGADPGARETGDNTTPLHWAAAHGDVDVVRALLDAGADVHGAGDLHEGDVIGWATLGGPDKVHRDVTTLLLERGARHHIFSAIAIGDLGLIRRLVADNPEALNRRRSRFEQRQTALHFAISRRRYDMVDLMIELGANLEAEDMHGETPLAFAMLRGDREAMSRLHAAGARPPKTVETSNFREQMAGLAGSVKKSVAMIMVPDVARALEWYTSIGFREIARYGDDGYVNFGMVSFGEAELMLNMHGSAGVHDASLWFYTDRIDDLYLLLKSRRLEAAHSQLTGQPGDNEGIVFEQDIEDMFYGARQFGIRDPNGYILYFIQPREARE